MKSIPYDEIIAKANARKDALQRYEAALHDFVHHLPQLQAAVGALDDFEVACRSLDSEALNLIGYETLLVLRGWSERVTSAYRTKTDSDPYQHITAEAAFANLTGLHITL